MLAIDICSKTVSIIDGIYSNGLLRASNCAHVEMKNDITNDGVITDNTGLSILLSNLIRENGLKSRTAAVTINTSQLVSRDFDFPALKVDMLNQLVRTEMLQVLGIDKEYGVDYIINGDTADTENNRLLSVRAYALPKTLIDSYYQLLKDIHISPVAMDIHANSIVKLLRGAKINNNQNEDLFLAVYIGNTTMEVNVFQKSGVPFSRLMVSPMDDFIKEYAAVSRKDVSEVSYSEIAFTEAALEEDGISVEIKRGFLSRITDELQRFVQFVLNNYSGRNISRIYLFGAIARFQNFETALTGQLNIPVEILNSTQNVILPAGNKLNNYAHAAGALMRL
ncbi:MAG: pilus assembly protein PilM [Clostridia bacterium]|nr:pilus assembly protein PilM [Clostridia bacterium]